jgi:fructuronate reductase
MTSSNATLANTTLPATVQGIDYDRRKLLPRIAHIGFGAFHRAHQALFNHELASKTDSDWGECAIELFGDGQLIKKLREQQYQYSIVEKGADSNQAKIIGSVIESVHANLEGCQAVLEKLAEPQIAIVSMTITEKGYCSDPATGELDKDNALIVHDLANPHAPQSAIGYLVEALNLRRERNLPAFSILSCDNVPENGHVARRAILGYANLLDQQLAGWIESHVSFPCTMVDRIVPAATPETLMAIGELLGVADPCGIATEPFRQWVIEDNFVAGRPCWEKVGAQLVKDVIPYENMKLRMLNGSHSFLAYLGYLGGYQHIDEAMGDAHYYRAVKTLMMREQAPTLTMPENTDLQGYADMLATRFCNPGLKHRTWQIAMDGSQKLPQRMLNSIRYHLQQGSDFSHLALGVAGWMRYISGTNEQGNAIDVRDPMATQLQAVCQQHGLNVSLVSELIHIEAIFGRDLAHETRFVDAVSQAYARLLAIGARQAVAQLNP